MDRLALQKLSYGLYILTTHENEIPFGCIINSAFQITSSPVNIAISLNRDNYTHEKIVNSRVFGLTILAEDADPSIIGTFGYKSGRETDKFVNYNYEIGKESKIPLLSSYGMTTIECQVVDKMEVGTHTIFTGEVIDSTVIHPDAREMTYKYYHEVRKGIAPKNAPTYTPTNTTEAKTYEDDIYICSLCKYEYHSAKGTEKVPVGTTFENLPENWVCPICGAKKELFNIKVP